VRTKELLHWIKERYAIKQKRDAGLPKPWTKDPILLAYRFCNVHREDDVVTRWITTNWRAPHADDPDFWFAAYVSRIFNRPDTLAAISYPGPWTEARRQRAWQALMERREVGERLFSHAYMVSTNGVKSDKVEYYFHTFDRLWAIRKELRPTREDTLRSFCDRLLTFKGIAPFMSGQIIADAKYVGTLREAVDWHTFASSGPGSRRGLNWVVGNEFNAAWKEVAWHAALMKLKPVVDQFAVKHGIPEIHAQDLQNCLCELGKTVKVLQGWGRPKSRYPGGECRSSPCSSLCGVSVSAARRASSVSTRITSQGVGSTL
jgi:hypothetical protein